MPSSGARIGRLSVVLLLTAALAATGPAFAARIVLVDMDGEGEGFNDPTPVNRVTGNSATTLGGQRRAVFEAAAWRLGRLIASPVEIRIEAAWDALDCEATSGTLASAGPTFVFRDFSRAPRRSTWYAAALADALAGEELGSTDENEMTITFNSDLGTPGCLTTLEWDYRIGVTGGRGVNMEQVFFHELGHGINFTSFVDLETGEKFNGFDDAYMLHLEDHKTGRTWDEMNNGQRRSSATRTGDLHWLGSNARAHAIRLREGTHAGTGHPQMYAPDPLEGGSSVAHWDTALDLNANEYMEPFRTRTSTDLLTTYLFEDIGWSVNRTAAGWVEDLNGNGSVEIAVLQVTESPAGHEVVLLDSTTGQTIRRMPLPADHAALDLAVVPHHAGPPASEIAVILKSPRSPRPMIVQLDASTGEQVRSFQMPTASPMKMVTVPDYAGTAAAELVIFGLRIGSGSRVWVKDAGSGALLDRLKSRRGERPVDMAILDSFGGTPAPEIAMLQAVPREGRSEILVRDARSSAKLARIPLPEGRVYQFLGALADFGGAVGAGELVAASVDADTGQGRLVVVDGKSGAELSGRAFREPFLPVALAVLPSFGGSMADEIVLWTRREGTLKPRAHIVDGGSMATLGNASLNSKQQPLALAVLPDIGRSAAVDTVVVAASERDRDQRAFLVDGRGGRIRTLVLP